MRAPVLLLEWKVALRRRRLLLFNVAIPLALVLPVALSPAPAPHAAAVYAVLFVLFGTFGSAIPLIRDGSSGFLERVRATGLHPASLLLQRAGAAAALDLLELLPSLAAVAWAPGIGARPGGSWIAAVSSLATLAPVLAGTLLVANLLGAWVAASARSLAEAALFSSVASLLFLHASGVFRTPEPGSLAAAIEAAAPFRALHEGLLQAAGAGSSAGGGAALAALLAAAVLLSGLTGLLASPLVARVSNARGK